MLSQYLIKINLLKQKKLKKLKKLKPLRKQKQLNQQQKPLTIHIPILNQELREAIKNPAIKDKDHSAPNSRPIDFEIKRKW